MTTPRWDPQSVRQLVTDVVRAPTFRRATFGGVVRRTEPAPWVRVVVQPIQLRGRPVLQFSYYDATKHVAKNVTGTDVARRLDEVLEIGFAGIHLTTTKEEIDVRTTKKGKLQVGRRPCTPVPIEPLPPHNRLKDVPLPEGRADRLLEALGIVTSDGRVRPTMRPKFTQLNEFLKQLRHVLDDAHLGALGRPIEILDCGCGSSYLTLGVHHYLNDILGIPARIVGVDVNEEVIRKSIERSERLGADGPSFACGPILAVDAKPDMVLALHACDTATDDALARAIRDEAALVLSVPCCHHHLNNLLHPTGPAAVLRPVLRHGILHQRTADLATDAFRASILRIMGYRTEVVEFISTEHTARNLMIRAVRGAPVGEAAFVTEYLEMRRFWAVEPYLEGLLGEAFQQHLRD